MIMLQHNCNGTAVTTVAALEAAIERGAEVACLQEPYFGRKHAISHPGLQIRWPESAKRDTRTASAIRNDALDRYVFEERTDLAGGPHVQCLDVWETVYRRKVRITRLRLQPARVRSDCPSTATQRRLVSHHHGRADSCNERSAFSSHSGFPALTRQISETSS